MGSWQTLKGELRQWGAGLLRNLPLPTHLPTKPSSPPPTSVSHSGGLGSWSIVTYCQVGTWGKEQANAGSGLISSWWLRQSFGKGRSDF